MSVVAASSMLIQPVVVNGLYPTYNDKKEIVVVNTKEQVHLLRIYDNHEEKSQVNKFMIKMKKCKGLSLIIFKICDLVLSSD